MQHRFCLPRSSGRGLDELLTDAHAPAPAAALRSAPADAAAAAEAEAGGGVFVCGRYASPLWRRRSLGRHWALTPVLPWASEWRRRTGCSLQRSAA